MTHPRATPEQDRFLRSLIISSRFFLQKSWADTHPANPDKENKMAAQSSCHLEPETNKGTNKMKETTNLTSARRRHLPYFALLLATITLPAFAQQSAQASGEMPFHANFITQFDSVVEFPLLHVTVKSQGRATYMGKTTAFTDDQLVNLTDGSGSATYTLTDANGDTLVLALVVPIGGTINVTGGVIFSGSYTITGGTGRFNGATGSGAFGGSGLFLTETDGIGAFAVVGTISSPGGLK